MKLKTVNESIINESKASSLEGMIIKLIDKIRKSFEKSDRKNFGFGAELAEIHTKLADFYREFVDAKYKDDQGYSKIAKESVKRHYDGIKKLLSKIDFAKIESESGQTDSDAHIDELFEFIDDWLKNYNDKTITESNAGLASNGDTKIPKNRVNTLQLAISDACSFKQSMDNAVKNGRPLSDRIEWRNKLMIKEKVIKKFISEFGVDVVKQSLNQASLEGLITLNII